MPIASKLVYFQRRPSPAPDPEPPDPRRRLFHRRGSSASRHNPGEEHVPGNKRDPAKSLGSAGNLTEHGAGVASGARLSRSVSDHDHLPDAVQQARERLLQRLNSVDLSGARQKTKAWSSSSEATTATWAGLTRHAGLGGGGVSLSTSAESILGSLTNCFQPGDGDGVATGEAEEDRVGGAPITVFSGVPVPELQAGGTGGGEGGGGGSEAPTECSICLERCGGGEDGGLIQLRCRHVFHPACLERWLRSRGDCPYCRARVLQS